MAWKVVPWKISPIYVRILRYIIIELYYFHIVTVRPYTSWNYTVGPTTFTQGTNTYIITFYPGLIRFHILLLEIVYHETFFFLNILLLNLIFDYFFSHTFSIRRCKSTLLLCKVSQKPVTILISVKLNKTITHIHYSVYS